MSNSTRRMAPTRFPNSGYSSLIGQVGRGGAIDGAARGVAHDENQSASLGDPQH